MGYYEALEAAGAKVLDYKEFGSYQGTWLAFVEYNGEKGIVEGAYGSCSGCDAFQSEFSYKGAPTELAGEYFSDYYGGEEVTKEEYDKLLQEYNQRLADFGRTYLVLETKEYYERKLANSKEDDWFDEEEKEFCKWAIDNYNKYSSQ